MKMVCATLFLTYEVSVVLGLCYSCCVCFHTDTLVLEPTEPVVVLPSNTKVTVTVKVVASSGTITIYSLDVSKGGSLLDALDLLMAKNVGFT